MRKERLLMFAIATGAMLPVRAQVLQGHTEAKSDVSWSDCGPGVSVDFTQEIVGPLTYQFTTDVQLEGMLSAIHTWMLVETDGWTGSFQDEELVHTFQQPGDQLVCLAVQGLTTNWEECAAITCKVVDVLQDSSCADLVADFTIAGVDGNTITFEDLSTFPAGIEAVHWNFQGEVSTSATPQHTFVGSGPHEVCLTVTGPGPVHCTRTVCKWLYLGPVPVPCEQLFTPGFIHVVYDRFVAVMDTSSTAGMERTVWWDFGDGSPAETGAIAVHEYDWPGSYELCSMVQFEGALTNGICNQTHCLAVEVGGMATLVADPATRSGPGAYPIPFNEKVHLTGLGPGPLAWALFDPMGTRVRQGDLPVADTAVVEFGTLPAGVYILRGVQAERTWSLRLIKE